VRGVLFSKGARQASEELRMTPARSPTDSASSSYYANMRSLANAVRDVHATSRPALRKDRLVNSNGTLFSASQSEASHASCGERETPRSADKDANHWIRQSIATSSSFGVKSPADVGMAVRSASTFTRFASTADGTTAHRRSGSMEIS